MQREIKFRAWDPGCKEMKALNSYYWEEYGSCDKDFSKCMADEDILMQYTGLKDKNGKEIYEGDIYKYCHENHEGVKECCEIDKFENIEDFYFNELIQYRVDDGEIIGNIYENPEILFRKS